MNTKKITRINKGSGSHWVGDGFPVTTMFSYQTQTEEISPFLLLDYAGPTEFESSEKARGVEKHPHRGFETVTIVYQGELEHSDNSGNAGKIGPGDVQWMTAGRGIIHEEMHGREFTRKGGTLEMVQLWVNLPAKDKMSQPKYQEILNSNIPVVNLTGDAGVMRLIAGEYKGTKGIANTFTDVNLWDMRLNGGHKTELNLPDGHNTSILVLSGKVIVNNTETLEGKELAQFSLEGEQILVDIQDDSVLLLMSGQPIDEPVVGRGPFVMNTAEEIQAAMKDYGAGLF